MKNFLIFTLTISGVLGIWWFFPDNSDVCYRYLDGRYSRKTATNILLSRRERVGSEFGIIDYCRGSIPYVDQDKLIINKEPQVQNI